MKELASYHPLINQESKDVFKDFKEIWAEYEYCVSIIKTSLLEIINNDDYPNDHCEITIKNGVITIEIKPFLSTDTLNKIETFLGVKGRIQALKTKKTAKIEIVFEDIEPVEGAKTLNSDENI